MHKFLWTWIDQGVPWNDGNQSSASNWKTLIYEQIPPIEMAYFPFTSIFIRFPFLARIGIRHRVFQIPPAEPSLLRFPRNLNKTWKHLQFTAKAFHTGATLAENRIAWHWQRRLLQPRLEAGRQLPGKPAPGRREAGRLVARWLPLTNSWKQAGSTNLFSCVPSLSTFEWGWGGLRRIFFVWEAICGWNQPWNNMWVKQSTTKPKERQSFWICVCWCCTISADMGNDGRLMRLHRKF